MAFFLEEKVKRINQKKKKLKEKSEEEKKTNL